ncbi:MAG: hypothetical protein ACKVRN_15585 [Pyrinomonadaceae bacterium]
MRTTLTLDEDVAYGLKKAKAENQEKSFKEIVNEILRLGLNGNSIKKPKKRFRVEPMNLGLRKDLNFDNIEELLDVLDGPNRL